MGTKKTAGGAPFMAKEETARSEGPSSSEAIKETAEDYTTPLLRPSAGRTRSAEDEDELPELGESLVGAVPPSTCPRERQSEGARHYWQELELARSQTAPGRRQGAQASTWGTPGSRFVARRLLREEPLILVAPRKMGCPAPIRNERETGPEGPRKRQRLTASSRLDLDEGL